MLRIAKIVKQTNGDSNRESRDVERLPARKRQKIENDSTQTDVKDGPKRPGEKGFVGRASVPMPP